MVSLVTENLDLQYAAKKLSIWLGWEQPGRGESSLAGRGGTDFAGSGGFG